MSTISASLLRLKLLDALRSGETTKVDSIINELQSTPQTTHTQDITLLKETVLHYAVQVAPASTLGYLITNSEKFSIDINSQDPDGNTPLHLAAVASRGDVIKYLLALPNINDTIVNKNKQQPVELCRDANIAQLMQYERAKFVEKSSIQLRTFFNNRDFDSLEQLLIQNHRASELLDINGSDPHTGNTVLHEYIKKDDLQMCEWILKHGGDPFKRDKRGKLPIDLIQNKNEPLKKLLKLASRNSNLMDPVINTQNSVKTGNNPTYKGYLRKWTNFAQGYKLRYFVLDSNGILSYYTNQDDTNNACRGSLNLSFAYLHLDSSEKLRFEIIGKNGIRWHLKANHPVESNRWVWTLQNAITISKDNLKKARHEEKAANSSSTPTTPSNNFAPNIATNNISTSGTRNTSVPTSPIDGSNTSRLSSDDTSSARRLLNKLPVRRSSRHKRNFSQSSITSEINNPKFEKEINVVTGAMGGSQQNLNIISEGNNFDRVSMEQQSIVESDLENYDYDSQEDYESEEEDGDSYEPGSENSFENLRNQVSTLKGSLQVGISSLLELFEKIEADSSTDSDEIYKIARSTLKTIHESFDSYNKLVESRDSKMVRKLERQVEINKLWENSIHQLEDEIAQREDKLAEYQGQKKQLKKYITESNLGIGSSVTGKENATTGPTAVHAVPAIEIFNDSDSDEDEFFDAEEEEEEEEAEERSVGEKNEQEKVEVVTPQEKIGADAPLHYVLSSIGQAENNSPNYSSTTQDEKKKESFASDEKGDITFGTSTQIKKETTSGTEDVVDPKSTSEKSDGNVDLSDENKKNIYNMLVNEGSFKGYEEPPRSKLAMDEDNRPKVGLWGILKSMIGKDMTRMTLPVSFNECTSLLQRLAEDIEYSNLLDTASAIEDSTLRMVYVAAFGASEYASTIDRIAKPFNPLLGETFEYCRPEKNYRLIVEQVSHHPPISACCAQSVNWDYYGENAVESQFKGRSFDFKHLGKMFCVVRPKGGVINTKGKRVAEELYTWKKVNTSVVGIIVGSPTVDNYGKMEVTNHTTGDVMHLNLKQRGWRASSAYQLSGHVVDIRGKTHWLMGGHWNSKIFAKKASSAPSDARRESLIETDISKNQISLDPQSGHKFLVWQATPRLKVPFNLTQFAITLNDPNKNLIPWLAPTDTRLRPDQRAMEDGKYDFASDEKHRVEEKQRAAKKERELKDEAYKAKWFTKRKHPVTGDHFWDFNGQYWIKRNEKALKNAGDIF